MDSRNRQNGSLPRIRVLSLGNCGVGKSCLIKRYCEQRFVQRYLPTIGIDYGSTTVEVDGRKVSVHFFDTSGSPLFEEVRTEFYPDMQGVMLVYDVTDKASFVALDHWMAELRHNLGQPGVNSLVLVVVGTRSDTSGANSGRQVTEGDGKAWATRHQARHVVTSAALGTGVTHAFLSLFSAALQIKEGVSSPTGPSTGTYSNNSSTTSKPTTTTTNNSNTNNTNNKSNTNNSKGNNTTNNSSSAAGTNNTSSSSTTGGGNKSNCNSSSSKAAGGGASKQPSAGSSSKPPDTAQSAKIEVDPEAAAAIHKLLHYTDHFQKMNLSPRTLSKDEVNKAYRRLAGLVHPDKCKAPGAEEAFKMLAQARTAVITMIQETTV